MKKDFIPSGLPLFDELFKDGIPLGKLTMICGSPNMGKTSPFMQYGIAKAKKIAEQGKCLIGDMLKHCEENGIPTPAITRHEEIGGVMFPITYFSDGRVIIDYPDTFLIKKR